MQTSQQTLFGGTSQKWVTYTDGACKGNPGPASWGAVVLAPNGEVSRHCAFIGHATNQVAEITAALEGLSQVPAGVEVELVSDSQYVLKGLSEWRAGWVRRGWLTAKGDPVANKDLWIRLFAVADARRVTTRWVRGHNGDPYNEEADTLANQAIAEARTKKA